MAADRAFTERLTAELGRWVELGLISPQQSQAIRGHYASAETVSEPRARAVNALAVVGAAVVGFGVILFFAANWEAIPRGIRLALLVSAIGAAYAAAYQLRDRRAHLPRVGEALYLLGVLLFGASLFLVGQMFHVQAHDPSALLIWAAGATATGTVVRSRAIAATAVAVFGGWLVYEYVFAVEDTDDDAWAAVPALLALYGASLYGLGTAARSRLADSGFAPAMRGLGLPLVAFGLFVFTFSDAADELGRARELGGWPRVGLLALVLVALASAAVLVRSSRRSAWPEAAALVVTAALFLVPLVAGGSDRAGLGYAIAFNIVFAALALGSLYAGYAHDESWLVNLGVTLVAFDVIGRYFDLFWGALPRSLGLIGAGLLVLGIAFLLERQRKRLLRSMRT